MASDNRNWYKTCKNGRKQFFLGSGDPEILTEISGDEYVTGANADGLTSANQECPPAGKVSIYRAKAGKGTKRGVTSTGPRNFTGGEVIEDIKSNPVPMILGGAAGGAGLFYLAKKKNITWFGKHTKLIFALGGAAIGCALTSAYYVSKTPKGQGEELLPEATV